MDWVWPLYEKYVTKTMLSTSSEPTDDDLQQAFVETLGRSLVTVLVQEPWRGSVRFKCLDKGFVQERFELLNNPEEYLAAKFGGGKFKLNFHDGWNFVATRNFKPPGDPLWIDLPEFDEESVA